MESSLDKERIEAIGPQNRRSPPVDFSDAARESSELLFIWEAPVIVLPERQFVMPVEGGIALLSLGRGAA